MALIFPSASQVSANPKWRTALVSPTFGNPAIASRLVMVSYMTQASMWAHRSKAAQAIISAVTNSKVDIYVIGMRNGGYSCFDSDCPEDFSGTVYFNIDVKLDVRLRDGVDATTREPKYRTERKTVDPLIAFLHELGHAKQFIENPDMFTRRAHGTNAPIPEISPVVIADAARKWAAGIDKTTRATMSTDPNFKLAKTQPDNPTPNKFVEQTKRPTYTQARNKGFLDLTNVRLTKPAWGVKLETDNLIRHEWPICRELGWPEPSLRHYTDIREL